MVPIDLKNYTKKDELRKIRKTGINNTLKLSNDPHNVFTPFELCDEIISKVHENIIVNKNFKYLVIANLEFLYVLKEHLDVHNIGLDNVWFATSCKDVKGKVATFIGIKEDNVIQYNCNDLDGSFENMPKFDVILGNPPYQHNEDINSNKLWKKFFKFAFTMVDDGGYVALVSPKGWGVNKLYNDYFLKYDVFHVNIDECGHYFKDVGSSFSYYVICKQAPTNHKIEVINSYGTFYIDEMPACGFPGCSPVALSIINKLVNGTEKFSVFMTAKYHSTKMNSGDSNFSRIKTEEHVIPILGGVSNNMSNYFYVKNDYEIDERQFNVPRVIMSVWYGKYNDMFTSINLLTCQHFYHYPTSSIEEANNLKRVFLSPLYRFIVKHLQIGGRITNMAGENLPSVDLSRDWTDQDLYDHFNLTSEEIELIERTVK